MKGRVRYCYKYWRTREESKAYRRRRISSLGLIPRTTRFFDSMIISMAFIIPIPVTVKLKNTLRH
jgi:hypothetical protein